MVTGTVSVLSNYLQRQMRRAKMDASDLAQKSGVPESTLRPILRGSTRQPDLLTLKQIAGPLGISFESLCRAVVELPPDAEEAMPEPNEARRELLEIFDGLGPDAQRRALNGFKELFGP